MEKHNTAYSLWVILFATLGSLTYGYCTSIIATTLGQPTFQEYFDLIEASKAAPSTGGLNGVYQGGGLFGCLSTAWFSDKYGRRFSIAAFAATCVIGGALQTASVHIAMLMIGRFVTGLGIGALVILIPLWQSEVATPANRGFLVGLHGVFILVGYALASWVGVGFFFVNLAGAQWRLPLAIQCIFPLLLVVGIKQLPESPRWLVVQGRREEALRILQKLHISVADDESHAFVQQEFDAIVTSVEMDSSLPCSWRSMFEVAPNRKRLVIGLLTMFCAQCTGTQVINNYGPSLYAAMGFNSKDQLLFAGGWIMVGVFGNYCNAKLLDVVGRRRLMTARLCGTAIALLGEAVMLALFQNSENKQGLAAAVFFLFFHLLCYATCLDASTYVYTSEIWPTHIRSKGAALSTSGLFIPSLVLLTASPAAFSAIGWRYYLILFSLTIISILVFARFPETKGKSLEEMDFLFSECQVVEGLPVRLDALPQKQ